MAITAEKFITAACSIATMASAFATGSFKSRSPSLGGQAMSILDDTAAKNAHLAQIISPEIKLSTEAIFYY